MPTDRPPVKPAPAWKRLIASTLDFLTVFVGGGMLIGYVTGNLTPHGFKLEGWAALALVAVFIAYFYIGRYVAGGTPWDRVFRIRRPQAED